MWMSRIVSLLFTFERKYAKGTLGIVVEDAPSGVKSGVASGARVLATCTSHTREQLQGIGATWIVTDLSR